MDVTTPLLTWGDLAIAADSLPADQRDIAQEIITAQLSETDAAVPLADGPWFIANIEVQGHVGIGAVPLRLPMLPTTGLTIVTAPNGTGKTSLVDGVRLVLSNAQERRYELVADNVHCSDRLITVTITNGPLTVVVSCDKAGIHWQPSDGDATSMPTVWLTAFERFLPVLLYPEMSPAIDKPASLHAFLREAFALTVLDELLRQVDDVRAKGREAEKHLQASHQDLLLIAHEKGSPLLDRLRLAGPTPPTSTAAELRSLASELPAQTDKGPDLPPIWQVDQGIVAGTLEAAAQLAAAQAAVIAGAEKVHTALGELVHGDGAYLSDFRERDVCPVCATTGASWMTTAAAKNAELGTVLKDVRTARKTVEQHVGQLQSCLPPALTEPTRQALLASGTPEAAARLADWESLVTDSAKLTADTGAVATVDDLAKRSKKLVAWYAGAAGSILAARDQGVASSAAVKEHVASWLDQLTKQRTALTRRPAAELLAKAVEQWIKDARSSIFKPIGDQVIQLWNDLNEDAEVKLTKISLEGGVRQAHKVDFKLSVDGTPLTRATSKPALLSTGQRNALSLAAYLPRATQPSSPFGFLVLDDPIHAFDTWRVRHLARQLIELAARYQIVVFTHDDRLWRELRSLGAHPRHISMERLPDAQSHVRALDASQPGQLVLDGLADVLNGEARFPLGTDEARVVMTLALCRQAVDTEVITQVEILGRKLGHEEADVREAINGARMTRQQLKLLNEYAAEAGLAPLTTTVAIESLISAMNDSAHGRLPQSATVAMCQQWVAEARTLLTNVYAVTA